MGLSSAMQWWEEWQLRILVLGSLFIQYILYFSIWVRRAPILRKLRVLVWIAYIGGDALAIYALATLFNRHKQTCDGESSALEVMWAPVLLIHLGGQTCISAYSLEDNELWKRHTITLVSQVTVALYVFCKWWSGGKMQLEAAILLFVAGTLKFTQKPWALRTASFNSLQASSTVFLLTQTQREEHVYSLEEYVQGAKKCVLEVKVDNQHEYGTESAYMFVDLSAPYSFRIAELHFFLMLEDNRAYSDLQGSLGTTFDHMYTKVGSSQSKLSFGSILLLPFLVLASAVLFAKSHKDGHNEKDIKVTYILLAALPCWSSYFPSWVSAPTYHVSIVSWTTFQVTGVVRQHVEDGWKKYISDAASYRRFSELRGQWALSKHQEIGWSLKMSYSESVLIWHVATDLCFYHPNTSPQGQQGEPTLRSREISNYMIYLLLVRPEMLMPGTRSDLFTLASDIIVENSKGSLDMTEENLAHEILNMWPFATDMVSNALKLSIELMELGDEKERWTLIQGVWMEMLCYSASRCRGYLHAKSLGDGGEFLSIIWLLLSVMGMETLADRHQRSVPSQEEATAEQEAPASTSCSGTTDQSEDNLSLV
ncbi:uncharacterized protein [Lolium perenne]|uniref:uncharacterized protein n=1 Tax=Lolium perenne TaxID=4522 RepID=UPI003A98D639